jgi:hypothetical protein
MNLGEGDELDQEDNPFPVYRPVGVHLQKKTVPGNAQLPRLCLTA